MELKALKDQLEVERQMWEATTATKVVGAGEAGTGGGFLPLPSCPDSKQACRPYIGGLPLGGYGFWLPGVGGVILAIVE